MAALILVIGLVGSGMADIDIPPCDACECEHAIEAGEVSPAYNQGNCTIIIIILNYETLQSI